MERHRPLGYSDIFGSVMLIGPRRLAPITNIRFIDLFCGIGGFHVAADFACKQRNMSAYCVYASDIDSDAQTAYEANFGVRPHGDIRSIHERDIPDHDVLFGGFPCQAFSIIGHRKGFDDTRGTLFFDIARIIREKQPRAFVLENVKNLRSHNGGQTLSVILDTLKDLGYCVDWRVLNALDYGLPQKRERIIIVGFREPLVFQWPNGGIQMKPLSEVLFADTEVDSFYWASQKIREQRVLQSLGKVIPGPPTIWHENKGGNVSVHPYSCAMRVNASYNYLLVNGIRRMTEREMLRLQGFPDSYKIVCSYAATRRQAGNSLAVPCIQAVVGALLDALTLPSFDACSPNSIQLQLSDLTTS